MHLAVNCSVSPQNDGLKLQAEFRHLRPRPSPCSSGAPSSLDHHCGELSVWAVYRGLQDDHAPPHMDRHSNAGQPPWHAGAKDIRLRFDRGCPKPRRDVEPGQSSAEIIGERGQCTAMHMAAVVEMTVINIEFADQLVLVGVGNAYAEMFRHTGTDGGGGHRRAPIRRKTSRRSYSNVNRYGWLIYRRRQHRGGRSAVLVRRVSS